MHDRTCAARFFLNRVRESLSLGVIGEKRNSPLSKLAHESLLRTPCLCGGGGGVRRVSEVGGEGAAERKRQKQQKGQDQLSLAINVHV